MSKIDFDISVYSYSDNTGERKKLFQRNVTLDESLNVPFDSIYRVLRFLYGKGCIVVFDMMELT